MHQSHARSKVSTSHLPKRFLANTIGSTTLAGLPSPTITPLINAFGGFAFLIDGLDFQAIPSDGILRQASTGMGIVLNVQHVAIPAVRLLPTGG